jgi:hypothetical protein
LWTAVAALVGPPKARKTWTLLELAVAVATGRRAFDRFQVPIPGPVLIIVEEFGRALLVRLRALPPPLAYGLRNAIDRWGVVCAESRSLRPDRWDWWRFASTSF